MQNRHNSSRKEESEQQQGVKTVHQQLPSSPVCFKSNTLLPCLLKLFFQKAYGKGGVSVWGYVRYRCASTNSLCRKLFEKGGVLLSVFRSAIMSTDYRLGSSWVMISTGPNRDQQQRGGNNWNVTLPLRHGRRRREEETRRKQVKRDSTTKGW